ncbi:MAG: hypothetical protein QM628_00040 [Propionicimonas sp.]
MTGGGRSPERTSKRLDGKPVARKSRLAEGEHSIQRAQVSTRMIHGTRMRVLVWRVRPYGFSAPVARQTTRPLGTPDRVLRAAALEKAAEILAARGGLPAWTLSKNTAHYCDQVVAPAIAANPRLAKGSVRQYERALRLLLGRCEDHVHARSLGPLTLRAATTHRSVVDCLQEIARLHGQEAAHQARTILTGYVFAQLRYDGLLEHEPLPSGTRIDVESMAREKQATRQGGVALSLSEYRAAVEWMLAWDPAGGVQAPRTGMYTLEHKIAVKQRAKDLTLLLMATGLRINEALLLPAANVTVDAGVVSIEITPDVGKGGYQRLAKSWNQSIDARLRELLASACPGDLLIGSPTDRSKVWDHRNATRAVKDLYAAMRERLGIVAFDTERSHVWRATLNSLLIGVVPEIERAAQFGHSPDVNRKSYTDLAVTDANVKKARKVLARAG